MVIDTSALVAVLSDEPERHEFNKLIAESPVRRTSAASYVEAGIVMAARNGRAGVHELKLSVTSASITVTPVDEEQAHVAHRFLLNSASQDVARNELRVHD